MIRQFIAAALASATLLTPALAHAEVTQKPIEEKKLASGRQSLSPSQGYIYLHAPQRVTIMLIKEPSAEELAAYEAEWTAALAEAKVKYPRTLASWREDLAWARKYGKTLPPMPPEPTEANFSIGRLDQRMIVNIGPQFIYAQQGEEFSYLHELEPGTYRYYGPVFASPNGAVGGVCACMGSVKFEVKPGMVTNLGDFLVAVPVRVADAALGLDLDLIHGPTDYALPERLAAFPHQEADWRAAGKIDNFYGLMVGRMPPVPGVLAYERDRVIDLKANGGASGAGQP